MQQASDVNLEVGISGHFSLVAVKIDGSGSRKLAEFDNLILNQGLDRLQTGGAFNQYCRVGSGSTAPAVGQTALVSQVAATTNVMSNTTTADGSAPYPVVVAKTYRFSAGQAAGNIAEVGVGWAETAVGSLFCRALVLDGAGQPTTITVLSDEFLQVTYTLTIYPASADVLATVNLGGVDTQVTMRPALLGGYMWNSSNFLAGAALDGMNQGFVGPGALGPVTGQPTGTQTSLYPSSVPRPYTAGSFTRDADVTLALDQGNSVPGGIKTWTIYFINWGGYQVEFTPAVPKTNTQLFTLRFRLTLARR